MITIKHEAESSFIIKKSKFLGLALRAENELEVKSILEQRRKKYFDATHNCYAYILSSGASRYSDDGEPQGTAGQPMLEVLKKSGLSGVIVISTRYFGGTLLGAGGLVRAYSKSASDTLETAEKVVLTPSSVYLCDLSYEVWAKAESLLKKSGYIIENINYSDKVAVTVCVKSGYENNFLELTGNVSLGQAVPKFIETKMIEEDI